MLEIFALVVLFVLVAVAIAIIVVLGNLPGKMARAAEHPQAEAIMVLGWVGLLTGGLGWLLALVWVKYRPESSTAELEQRIEALESELRQRKEVNV